MKKFYRLLLILLGFFTALFLILIPNFKGLSQTQTKVLSQNEIEAIAKMTVVFHAPVLGRTKEDSLKDLATKKYLEDRIGSGVIIAKQDNVYYALTNVHVLEPKCGDHLIARDSKKIKRKEQEGIHIIPEKPYNGSQAKCDQNFKYFGKYDYEKSDYIDGFDLAIIKFTSKRNYFTISIDNLDSIQQDDKVFVFGFPIPKFQENRDSGDIIIKSTSGTVKSLYDPKPNGGYDFAYTNPTVQGMSGGLVLNEQGYLVGIHAAGITKNPKDGGQGIRIKHFLDIIGQGNSLISLSDLNFDPPSQELIDEGKENDGVIENIDEILFLCPEIENKTPSFMETER
ncbi:MAG: trypsin-like peptidase domain-containing protein [Moorea sp. SIO3I7]|uniref:S1 family peptidase n=1 Tax=unclassified Moorena TaxID=2683338 RepID=UPI0013C2508F|nr:MULTISPECIES: serine protease [unclassified Moorena]NEN94020.1 trypsin-like peptidase domain-containing protein [Moorena sp. SIO3I7]NEO05269.1 trypsin-like peptidase domain-containing protein [Moorena sp. SIO3I8]NEO23527.1 trypsin-like peptidase domain-containing protein [Moorena sp. SIO4A5]